MKNRRVRIGARRMGERTSVSNNVLLPPSFTLQEAVNYVNTIKRAMNLKQRTLNGYAMNMSYWIDWMTERYGQIAIRDVTGVMLREYVLWCAEEKVFYEGHPFKSEYSEDRRGMSPASVNVRIRVLRTYFNTLYKENIINNNPASNISLMRQDVDTVQPLTQEELSMLLKAPDQKQWAQWRDYIIMLLILDTGMRVNEVCALEKHEIDFIRKVIRLPASKNKNRKNRILPLSNETNRLLRQLIKETEETFDSTFVFTTNYGDKLSEKTIAKSLERYADKVRLGRTVSAHILRHNFATMAAESGMSIFHLQKILGHADITTTRKYVQLSESSISEEHRIHTPLKRLTKRKGN